MSKLRIYIQLLFWALLPTLMGCSADDSLVLLPNLSEEEPMEIRLYATTLAQADAVVTRISNGSFEAEDEIGVCITNYYENTLFTRSFWHSKANQIRTEPGLSQSGFYVF